MMKPDATMATTIAMRRRPRRRSRHNLDPDPEEGLAQERRLGRLLIAMVVAIVASGFIGTLLALAGLGGN